MIYDVIGEVFVVLALSLVLGEILEQARLPSVAGALLGGIILGPTVLGVVSATPQTEGLSLIALFFIIFTIGLEMRTHVVRKQVGSAAIITLTAFVIPLLITVTVTGILLPFGPVANFVLSLAITVPSISIISVIVMERHLLEKPSGAIIISSAAVADILAFIVLSSISQPITGTLELLSLLTVLLIGFISVDIVLNQKTASFQKALAKGAHILRSENVSYAILIVAGLSVSLLFQLIGLSYIIGAFFAGLILHEGLIGREAFGRISRTFNRMNRAFFIPIFFGFAGVEANLTPSLYGLLVPLSVLILAGIIPAILLTYMVSSGFLKMREKGDSRDVAVIMAGKGAVGIIIATIASDSGQIGIQEYSLIIVGILAVSLIVPLLIHKQTLKPRTEPQGPYSKQ
jgi:Kef-type K+ transport system membrane component KefB